MQLAKDRQPLPEIPLIAAKNLYGPASRTPEELANIVSLLRSATGMETA
jgi:hypothetical protein